MRVIFAGTPEFARVALQALQRAGFEIPLVLTQPDRPAGRGMTLQASSVKQFALEHGMPVAQPRSLRLDGKYPEDAAAAQAQILAARADVMVVAAYGLILPKWVLQAPRLGCLNIHASLLPRWRGAAPIHRGKSEAWIFKQPKRGAAPIHRAIEAGDAQTGITIMQMDEGLDTGDMLLVETLPISGHDTTVSLHDQLAALGGRLIVEALELAACGGFKRQPQPSEGVTYAAKIEKAEGIVDWRQTASVIERKIRAFQPAPACSATLRGESIKLLQAQALSFERYENKSILSNSHEGCGTILQADTNGVEILCGEQSVLRVTQLQRAGGKRLSAAEFLRGFALSPGERFEGSEPQ
jgi:methionyl-tRNA formyltransferase